MITFFKILAEQYNWHFSFILAGALAFLASFFYFKLNRKKMCFLFIWVGLTTTYFFCVLEFTSKIIAIGYSYHLLVFTFYHIIFTFSRHHFLRALVIIKGYLSSQDFTKLGLWFFLIFFCSLLAEPFIILAVLIPLFIAGLAAANYVLVLFLFLMWCWLFFLTVSNWFTLFTVLLEDILRYFSRRACLHFVGNGAGSTTASKAGPFVVMAPVAVSLPATGIYVVETDAKIGNYAYDQLQQQKLRTPEISFKQQYDKYVEIYNGYANSSIAGRTLLKMNLIGPAAPEAIIPNFNTGLEKRLSDYLPK